MLTEMEARNRIIKSKKDVPYSCAFFDYFYVFCMEKEGTVFWAVDKKTGDIYPFTPGLDLAAYSAAKKHVY